ncbi:MAG: S-layer homology domain-containing protein, partial [Clostridia bacterium]
AKNVVVKVEQKPVLKTIEATMKDDFVLRVDENAVLADQFTAVGYDQYDREMDGVQFDWVSSKPDVVSLKNGTLTALKEDSTEIYATSGDVESNRITLTVDAARRVTSIAVDCVPCIVFVDSELDLTTAAVTAYDQFRNEFTEEELAAYPASIRWTLEKNDTDAVINGDLLRFGDKEGTMTLICAVVNADTNVIVEKKIDISITTGTTFSPDAAFTRAQAVTFLWRAAGCPEPQGSDMPFTDVAADAYYYDAVLWAVENGITVGTTETTFSPYEECTRAQSVSFMWRAAGSPKPISSELVFTDVEADDYFAKAVLWAVEEGITVGTSETTFSPYAYCTRAQSVSFLWREAGSPEPNRTDMVFTDVEAGTYYYNAVLWAVEHGITKGT